jgi:hypothetical protein
VWLWWSQRGAGSGIRGDVVVALVEDHNLYHVVEEKLLPLAHVDPAASIPMIVRHLDKVCDDVCDHVLQFHAL